MEKLKWNSTFDVGVPLMNQEHKNLIDQMQKLSELCHKTLPKQQILAAYDTLIKYTEAHFADEEALMDKLEYKEAEAHKKLHRTMLEKLYKYRHEFVVSVYGVLPTSVFDFFENWLLTHILIVDQRYGDMVKKSKIEAKTS